MGGWQENVPGRRESIASKAHGGPTLHGLRAIAQTPNAEGTLGSCSLGAIKRRFAPVERDELVCAFASGGVPFIAAGMGLFVTFNSLSATWEYPGGIREHSRW